MTERPRNSRAKMQNWVVRGESEKMKAKGTKKKTGEN